MRHYFTFWACLWKVILIMLIDRGRLVLLSMGPLFRQGSWTVRLQLWYSLLSLCWLPVEWDQWLQAPAALISQHDRLYLEPINPLSLELLLSGTFITVTERSSKMHIFYDPELKSNWKLYSIAYYCVKLSQPPSALCNGSVFLNCHYHNILLSLRSLSYSSTSHFQLSLHWPHACILRDNFIEVSYTNIYKQYNMYTYMSIFM